MGTSPYSSPRGTAQRGWRRTQGPGWLDEDDTPREVAYERERRPPRRLTLPPMPRRRRDVSLRSYDERDAWRDETDEADDRDDDQDDWADNERDGWAGEDERDTSRRRAQRGMTGPQTAAYSNPRLRSSRREGERTRGAGRNRERTSARPLALELSAERSRELARLEPASDPGVPALAARQAVPARRPRLDTRAIARTARNPWSVGRTLLAVIAISAAIWTSLSAAGEPSQPLMSFQAGVGSHDARAITRLVQPETQGKRPDLYDSVDQFNAWWDAACSAAVMSEILTAWGKQGTTIGRMIDVMQPDISLNGGLLTPHGFQRGAAVYGYRADISWKLTYKQMLYITNVLGLPVIVNVRISYGYYHFFSGGHFLVVTGGDDQGLTIVDSSEYYIHYLPIETFTSMFTGMTAIVVPQAYSYNVP